ncbi:beta-lactamase/transpeptidase-like protein [Ramicandelaber brevisporus]|nr:beta-lactamase/transpeptidase-like protein [Ramicandelaber brevisporus]
MRLHTVSALVVALSFVAGQPDADAQEKQIIADFEHDFSAVLKRRQVPGMMYTVVRQNKTIVASGLGVADMNNPDSKVDGDTLFMIGSVTKSMTAALFGTAVDEGKVKFADRVSSVLPQFRLKDPVASVQCRFEDAMSHRTGLPRHDMLMFFYKNDTLNTFLGRLTHLEPHTEFRSNMEYSNHMWAVTGHAAAAALGDGVTYEAALKARIFDKVGMKTALLGLKHLPQSKNKVPHGYFMEPNPDGTNYTLTQYPGYEDIGIGAPAAMVLATANDAAAYLRMMLGKGLAQDGKTRVLSEATYNEIIRSRVVFPNWATTVSPLFSAEQMYAQGWFQTVYRKKHRVIYHDGGMDGFITLFAFFPDDDLAIAASINQFSESTSHAAVYDLADRFLGYRDVDWGEVYGKLADSGREGKKQPERATGTHPSRPLEAFTGNYQLKGYGTLRIDLANNGNGEPVLNASIGDLGCSLKHAQYDTFACRLFRNNVDFTFFSMVASKTIDKVNVGDFEQTLGEVIFSRIL